MFFFQSQGNLNGGKVHSTTTTLLSDSKHGTLIEPGLRVSLKERHEIL